MAAEPHLQITRSGVFAEVRLHRPDRRNALSAGLLRDLLADLRTLDAAADVRSIILTGSPPAFCAGLDLQEVERRDGPFDCGLLIDVLDGMERVTKPIIAAVNGPAAAGGLALVCACDFALAAESASFGCPGIRQGLVAPLLYEQIRRCAGERAARRLFLSGEMISAETARAIGLVDEIRPADDLLPAARQLSDALARIPGAALAAAKSEMHALRRLQPAAGEVKTRCARVLRISSEAPTAVRFSDARPGPSMDENTAI